MEDGEDLPPDADADAPVRKIRLRARGRAVRALTAATLGAETLRWHHRLGAGGVDFILDPADGRTLSPHDCGGVVNRLHYLPLALLARIGGADEDYARSELYALFLSWMAALPSPILNPPTPQGLAGNWRHPSAWTMLAQASGLPVVPWRQDSASDPERDWTIAEQPGEICVVAVGDRLVRPGWPAAIDLPAPVEQGCIALARAAGVGLLGVRLIPDDAIPEGWRFVGANLLPDLAAGGEPMVEAIDAAFAS